MASEGSVTHWIGQLQAGNPAAAQPLWERYFQQLVHLARKKLQGRPRRAADEEDVALSAFDSFCRAAEAKRFPQLADRDDLWRLLVALTARKASHFVRDECREKRGGGHILDERMLTSGDGAGLDQIIGAEPTPDFAAQVAEECRRLLDLLGDDKLRFIAISRMEGYSTEEIAGRLGCAPRTVERCGPRTQAADERVWFYGARLPQLLRVILRQWSERIRSPSGCGNSSRVRAGLLPQLSQDVIALYVEATAGEPKIRMLNGLR
jgi:DNA-directed RNA polymerase specialized sigma24 family protein